MFYLSSVQAVLSHMARDDKYDEFKTRFTFGSENYVLCGSRFLCPFPRLYMINIFILAAAEDWFAGSQLKDLAIDKRDRRRLFYNLCSVLALCNSPANEQVTSWSEILGMTAE